MGVLVSAVLVAFVPAPAHVVYVVFAVLFVGEAAMVLRLAETLPRMPGAWASVRPAIKVPSAARRKLLAAAPVLFSVWALSGLFGSLGPDLVHQVSGSSSPVYGAAPLAILSAMSPVTAYVTRSLPPRRLLGIGITALAAGVIAAVAGEPCLAEKVSAFRLLGDAYAASALTKRERPAPAWALMPCCARWYC